MKLTVTAICQSPAHCERCRNKEVGRRYRAAWAERLEVPAAPEGEPREDFLCPAEVGGKPWGWRQPSRGLGDTIAKVTSAMGIKPCGKCKERQKLLNRLVPYRPDAQSPQSA